MDRVRNIPEIRLISHIGDNDDFLQGRDGFGNFCYIPQGAEGLSFVEIAVHREQDLGFYLTESIQCSLGPAVRGARRPDSPDTGRRQHGNGSLHQVWHVACHPVSWSNPYFAQGCRQACYSCIEFCIGHLRKLLGFSPENKSHPIISIPQKILCEIELRSYKPLRPWELSQVIYHLI